VIGSKWDLPLFIEAFLTGNSRYNLKRRVTSLPPITSEVFTDKVLAAQASSTAAASRASYERTCGACEKTYFSENAYDNHLGSQKHRSRVSMLRRGAHGHGDDSSSVVSSAVDIESQTTGQVDMDSDSEEEFDDVVEGIKSSTIKDEPAAGRSSRPHSKVDSATAETATSSSDAAASESSAPTALPLQRCLFCNYDSPTIPLNVLHMERIHGMFIPERNYLVDLDGLVGSLYEKIYEFHECLYCQKLKPTVFGLQTHMRDKGHCKIPFGTEDEQLEIGEFYDFTSTYSDVEDDEDEEDEDNVRERGGVKLGARRKAKSGGNDDDEEAEEGDGWETDSSASSLDSADLTAVPLDQHMHQYEKLDRHLHHSSQDPRPHRNKDGWHSHAHKHTHAAFYSDYELHLPSGRAVGHRSLNKYYRQNLHNHPSPAELQEQFAIEAARGSDSDEEDQQVSRRNDRERGRALTSRANGGTGMMGVSDQKKREVATIEKKARHSQKHFRVSFCPRPTNGPSSLTLDRIPSCSERLLGPMGHGKGVDLLLFCSLIYLKVLDVPK